MHDKIYMRPPCIAGNQEQCISHSGVGKLFKHMMDGQIGKINRLFELIFSDSVCTITKLNLGEKLWVLTPTCEAVGLCDSLVDIYIIFVSVV